MRRLLLALVVVFALGMPIGAQPVGAGADGAVTVTVDPVDLLVFGVTGHRARGYRQQPGFGGLFAHKDDRQSCGFGDVDVSFGFSTALTREGEC